MTWPPRGTCHPHVPHLTPAPAETWRDNALCAEVDPDLLFPEKGITARRARKVCAACTVRAECLEWALSLDPGEDEYGVLGGLTAPERRKLRQRQRQEAA